MIPPFKATWGHQ